MQKIEGAERKQEKRKKYINKKQKMCKNRKAESVDDALKVKAGEEV